MPRKQDAKPPVKPIGRILYSQILRDYWFHKKPGNRDKVQPEPTYDSVCECKGFTDDRPFSVYFHKDPKDPKPFKVVFHWTNSKFKSFTFDYNGSPRTEMDGDTYHMTDILEAHATKSAAQKAMRKYATIAFDKVNNPATSNGDVCHAVATNEKGKEIKLRIGELIEYSSCPGIVWRIVGERRTKHDWSLQVEPVFSLLVRNGTNKPKEIAERDVYNYVHPIDLMSMGTAFNNFALVIQDEARRRGAQ